MVAVVVSCLMCSTTGLALGVPAQAVIYFSVEHPVVLVGLTLRISRFRAVEVPPYLVEVLRNVSVTTGLKLLPALEETFSVVAVKAEALVGMLAETGPGAPVALDL
jgi:hypothetical protein